MGQNPRLLRALHGAVTTAVSNAFRDVSLKLLVKDIDLFQKKNVFMKLMLVVFVNFVIIEILSFLLFENNIILNNEIYRDSWFDCDDC